MRNKLFVVSTVAMLAGAGCGDNVERGNRVDDIEDGQPGTTVVVPVEPTTPEPALDDERGNIEPGTPDNDTPTPGTSAPTREADGTQDAVNAPEADSSPDVDEEPATELPKTPE